MVDWQHFGFQLAPFLALLFGAGAITLLSLGPWPAALRIPIPGNRPAPTAGPPGQVAMPTEMPLRTAPVAQVLGGERPPLLGDTPRATTTEAPSPTAWYEALADWPWGHLLAGMLLAGTLFALSRLLVGLLAIRSCRRRRGSRPRFLGHRVLAPRSPVGRDQGHRRSRHPRQTPRIPLTHPPRSPDASV